MTTGLLARMDPRAKIVLLVASAVIAFLGPEVGTTAAHAALLVMICAFGLGVRELLRPVRALLPILVFLVILTPLFHPEGAVLVSVAGRPWITDLGLGETYRFLCRLVAVALAFYLFFRTTEMDAAISGARWFGLPYNACLVLGVAYRLIPSTAALYQGIVDAHSLRRPPHGTTGRGPLAMIRRAVPVVTAVLVHSVKGIPVLAMALETRGVGRGNRRTTAHPLPSPLVALRDGAIGFALLALPHLLRAI